MTEPVVIRFRVQSNAASLKQLEHDNPADSSSGFPRSIERGLIEAVGTGPLPNSRVSFRVQSNAASLKRVDLRALRRRELGFRVQSNAASLKPFADGSQQEGAATVSAFNRTRPH